MTKVVQTRVDEEVERRLREKAKADDTSLADFVRGVLENVGSIDEPEVTIREQFRTDLRNLVRTDGQELVDAIQSDTWETISDPAWRTDVRETLEDATGVYVVGHGSSHSVARWLAGKLDDRTYVTVGTTDRISQSGSIDGSVLVAISRSGETTSIVEQVASLDDGVTTVALTRRGSTLDDLAEYTIPVPAIQESVEEYASRSLVAQVVSLQVALFDDESDLETLGEQLDAVDRFVDAQFEGESLASGSPFKAAAEALEAEDDIRLAPIVSTVGRFYEWGYEAVLKHAEFLHANASVEDLGSIRDRLLNVLFSDDAYLLTMIPYREDESYRRCAHHLFTSEYAIEDLLKFNIDPTPLRLFAFTFNDDETGDPQNFVERAVEERSLYGERAVVPLPSHDDSFVDDLVLFAAIYLLTYAILERRWHQDRHLRRTIIRRCYGSGDALEGESG